MFAQAENHIKKWQGLSQFKSKLSFNEFTVFEVEKNKQCFLEQKDSYQFYLLSENNKKDLSYCSSVSRNTSVLFLNPYYDNRGVSLKNVKYGCVFSKSFLKRYDYNNQIQLKLVRLGSTPIIKINDELFEFFKILFKRMIKEEESGKNKNEELINNYIGLIVHELIKTKSCSSKGHHIKKNATSRIVDDFFDMLEGQFPVKCKNTPIYLRTAQGFADAMLLHANHLNRSLKKLINKTTKTLINERITIEAIEILLNTDWNVSEIAHALGFEHASYFNNFFKRMTSMNPNEVRKNGVENHKDMFDFHRYNDIKFNNFTNQLSSISI